MKKTITMILTAIIITACCFPLAGCRQRKVVKKYDNYEILLNGNTLGGIDDTVTPMNPRPLFDGDPTCPI